MSNLGFIFDSHLNFEQQVNNCVSSIFASIKNFARKKYYLTKKELSILVSSLIVSKLDYCNSLYNGINSSLLKKLQYAQNSAARLIFNRKKFDHVTDLFYELHWLPVRYKTQNKICLLTYKCINSTLYSHPDELRSLLLTDCSRANRLKILRNILKISDGAFSVCAPKLWNQLPSELKNLTSLTEFKRDLKTFLFCCTFNNSDD